MDAITVYSEKFGINIFFFNKQKIMKYQNFAQNILRTEFLIYLMRSNFFLFIVLILHAISYAMFVEKGNQILKIKKQINLKKKL